MWKEVGKADRDETTNETAKGIPTNPNSAVTNRAEKSLGKTSTIGRIRVAVFEGQSRPSINVSRRHVNEKAPKWIRPALSGLIRNTCDQHVLLARPKPSAGNGGEFTTAIGRLSGPRF